MKETNQKTVASMGVAAAQSLAGYAVEDVNGVHIGALDGVWMDPSTQNAEFFGITHGNIFKQTPVVPARLGAIDDSRQIITVPWSQEFIKSAPSYKAGEELAEVEKQQVTEYFGCFVPTNRETSISEIRPEETNGAPSVSSDLVGEQPVDREKLEEGDQAFFNNEGFVTDAMPSVDVSKNLEKTQKQARVREAEDEARSE